MIIASRPGTKIISLDSTLRIVQPTSAANWYDGAVWAYHPARAGSYAASLANLANPGTYDAIEGQTPGWGVGGWSFDGVTQYLTAGNYLPPTDQVCSFVVQIANVSNNGFICGKSQGVDRRILLQPNASSGIQYANGAFIFKSPALTDGNLAVLGANGYRNGVSDVAGIGAWGGVTSGLGFGLGCATTNSSAISLCAGDILAIGFWEYVLSESELSTIISKMS